MSTKGVWASCNCIWGTYGERAKSSVQTDMKKREENMAVLLQGWHGLEKLDMFNMFAKLTMLVCFLLGV